MTTRNSSLNALKTQAAKIAAMIKAFERGETVDVRFAEKIKNARANKSLIKIGIMMDDKAIVVDLEWSRMSDTTEAALTEYILDLMRETRGTVN